MKGVRICLVEIRRVGKVRTLEMGFFAVDLQLKLSAVNRVGRFKVMESVRERRKARQAIAYLGLAAAGVRGETAGIPSLTTQNPSVSFRTLFDAVINRRTIVWFKQSDSGGKAGFERNQ